MAVVVVASLCPLIAWFALADHHRLIQPLTAVLSVAAIAANLMEARIQGPIWLSASFVSCLMAAAFLGPAAAFAVPFLAEVADWFAVNSRWLQLAVNCLGAIAPTMLASSALQLVASGPDLVFDVTLAASAAVALALNIFIVAVLMSAHEGVPIGPTIRANRHFLPLLASNIAFLVVLGEAYRRIGIEASGLLILVVLSFSYVLQLLASSRDNTKRIAELSTSRGRLVAQALDAEDRARRRLAERLHDEAIQNLLVARDELREGAGGDRGHFARAEVAVRRTIANLRGTIFDLHPMVLDHAGLAAALEALTHEHARRGGLSASVVIDPDAVHFHEQLLYSLARELLFNVVKHARAHKVGVRLTRTEVGIELEVTDDGDGFDPDNQGRAIIAGHIGLATAQERTRAVGGTCEITSAVGDGTRVRVYVPTRSA